MHHDKYNVTYHWYFVNNDELAIGVPHMYMIELGLIILVCLSIDNPNKKWIIISFINKVAFAMYDTIQKNCLFFVFVKQT